MISAYALNWKNLNPFRTTSTYSPAANATGIDFFQYAVTDKAGALSNAATVTVAINNPPTAMDNIAPATPVDVPILLNLIENDTDTDGVLARYVATFDGGDRMTWTNLNLDGTPAISKFIRFKTTDTHGVLFDYEKNTRWDAGISSISDFLKLRLGLYGSPSLIQVNDIADFPAYGNGQWHSTGFTFDGTTVQAYFDGLPSGTSVGNLNGQTVSHNFTTNLGRRTLTNGIFITGDFYDFVVYDKALTNEQVLDYHYGVINPENLVVWGKMNESDYASGLLDWSGNQYNGTSDGATPVLDASRIDIEIVNGPTNGKISNHLDGTVTYTPNAGFSGPDMFTYQVRDDDGALSNIATVPLTVGEDSDNDGLSDIWEIEHFGDLSADPAEDPDNDTLTNLEEQHTGTDPNNADTDDDGLSDGAEVADGLNPVAGDTDNDGIFDFFDMTPTLSLQPHVHPLYFDASANGFAFPLVVNDNDAMVQLNGLINFGDAVTPFPQRFDPVLNDWIEATNLVPNVGYLAYALDEENANFSTGQLSHDFTLELESRTTETGLNLIAMPLTTPFPTSEAAIVTIYEDDRGIPVIPALGPGDTLFKNKLYWIESQNSPNCA